MSLPKAAGLFQRPTCPLPSVPGAVPRFRCRKVRRSLPGWPSRAAISICRPRPKVRSTITMSVCRDRSGSNQETPPGSEILFFIGRSWVTGWRFGSRKPSPEKYHLHRRPLSRPQVFPPTGPCRGWNKACSQSGRVGVLLFPPCCFCSFWWQRRSFF